jgi:hypothetical protein
MRLGLRVLVALAAGWGCGCGGGGGGATEPSVELVYESGGGAGAGVGETFIEPLVFRLRDQGGAAVAGRTVRFRVTHGGGRVVPDEAVSGPTGRVEATWTMGAAPVMNRLEAAVDTGAGEVVAAAEALAYVDRPVVPSVFGDFDGFLTGQGLLEGTTGAVAFDGAGSVVVGAVGRLLRADSAGNISVFATSGVPLAMPVGLAFDAEGVLWVVDAGAAAVLRVDTAGQVTTALTSYGGQPLVRPNAVAVLADGRLAVSDGCRGEVVRWDPVGGEVDAVAEMPEGFGGPSGLALDEGGQTLWVTTENAGRFCEGDATDPKKAVGALVKVAIGAAGFGAAEVVAPGLGQVGRGLAFDAEQNLYAAFDEVIGAELVASRLWVLAAPLGGLEPVVWASTKDRILAFLAFADPSFGDETILYMGRWAIIPYTTGDARGLDRLEAGVPGLELTP